MYQLSEDLTGKLGKGFSQRYLELCRKFYSIYSISESVISKLMNNNQKFLDKTLPIKINIDEEEKYILSLISNLTWTHFVELIKIKDNIKRSFYETECLRNNWTIRELRRQKDSLLFERFGLSKDKAKVRGASNKDLKIENPQDLLKNPYIFEFLGVFII